MVITSGPHGNKSLSGMTFWYPIHLLNICKVHIAFPFSLVSIVSAGSNCCLAFHFSVWQAFCLRICALLKAVNISCPLSLGWSSAASLSLEAHVTLLLVFSCLPPKPCRNSSLSKPFLPHSHPVSWHHAHLLLHVCVSVLWLPRGACLESFAFLPKLLQCSSPPPPALCSP